MNLYEKLIEIRKSVPYLQKSSDNKAQGFKYTSSSQVLHAIRKEMDEKMVLLVPEIIHGTVHEKSKIGGKMHVTELEMRMTWIDAEEPQVQIPCNWYAQGTDQHEKGVGKALTYAEKFFLLKFFNIATDKDDPDAFEARATGSKTKKKPKAQPKAPPKDKPKDEPILRSDQNKLFAKMTKAGYDKVTSKEMYHWHLGKGEPTKDWGTMFIKKFEDIDMGFIAHRLFKMMESAGYDKAESEEMYDWHKGDMETTKAWGTDFIDKFEDIARAFVDHKIDAGESIDA